MNVKEPLLSNCEKAFIINAINGGTRHDGRTRYKFRPLKISLGVDWGSCHVALGETRVLAHVTCEVQQPKPSRPNDGLLYMHLEMGPMAAPYFEAGRQSDLGVLINRLLEKAYKDSKVIDRSMLCISANRKVWAIRIDLNVLNHDGNVIDAASVAAITALAHFRLPDVSMKGINYVMYDSDEREPIPLRVLHYPVYITFAVFNNGARIIADPTALEERVAEGRISLAVNSHNELCGLHLSGGTLSGIDLVLNCSRKAVERAKDIVKVIKNVIKEDTDLRKIERPVGYAGCLRTNQIPSYSEDSITIKLKSYRQEQKADAKDNDDDVEILTLAPKSAVLKTEGDTIEEDSSDSDVSEIIPKIAESIDISNEPMHEGSDSEEETVVTL